MALEGKGDHRCTKRTKQRFTPRHCKGHSAVLYVDLLTIPAQTHFLSAMAALILCQVHQSDLLLKTGC